MNTTTDSGTDRNELAPASDSDDPARPHVVARAQRTRAVHLQGPDPATCGLCLGAWPCAPRSWAELTLGR
jgi:hypothetical protein